MSEPNIQRWECETNEFGDSDMQKNIIGNYVRYEDYVRLKTDVENSKRINTELLVLSNRQASDIRRLTKAGDAMWNALLCSGCSECMGMYNCHEDGMKAWESAKKGGQP